MIIQNTAGFKIIVCHHQPVHGQTCIWMVSQIGTPFFSLSLSPQLKINNLGWFGSPDVGNCHMVHKAIRFVYRFCASFGNLWRRQYVSYFTCGPGWSRGRLMNSYNQIKLTYHKQNNSCVAAYCAATIFTHLYTSLLFHLHSARSFPLFNMISASLPFCFSHISHDREASSLWWISLSSLDIV